MSRLITKSYLEKSDLKKMMIDSKMLLGVLIAILLSLSTWTLLNTHYSKVKIEVLEESIQAAEKNTNRIWGLIQSKF